VAATTASGSNEDATAGVAQKIAAAASDAENMAESEEEEVKEATANTQASDAGAGKLQKLEQERAALQNEMDVVKSKIEEVKGKLAAEDATGAEGATGTEDEDDGSENEEDEDETAADSEKTASIPSAAVSCARPSVSDVRTKISRIQPAYRAFVSTTEYESRHRTSARGQRPPSIDPWRSSGHSSARQNEHFLKLSDVCVEWLRTALCIEAMPFAPGWPCSDRALCAGAVPTAARRILERIVRYGEQHVCVAVVVS
jgi:hypothetical protein